MILVKNISYQTSLQNFEVKKPRMIRFSTGNYIATSKTQCIYLNSKTVQWSEIIQLPMVLDEGINFQIYSQHEFGFGSSALQAQVQGFGIIMLERDKKMGKWGVYIKEDDLNIKIGSITAKYKIQQNNNKITVHYQNDQKIPVQILVKNLAKIPQNAFIILDNGFRQLTSPVKQPLQEIKGQFLFYLRFSHKFLTNAYYDQIKVKFYEKRNEDLIGQASIKLKDENKIEGAWLLNQENVRVGDVFINRKPQTLKLKPDSYLLELDQPRSKLIVEHKDNKYQQKTYQFRSARVQQQSQKQEKILDDKGSASERKPTKSIQSKDLSKHHSLKHSRSSKSYMSIIHSNNNIKFSTEPRFKYKQMKNTQIFVPNMPSLISNQNKGTGSYYKGTSNGSANRISFAKKVELCPGVGSYNLPSIFDRY